MNPKLHRPSHSVPQIEPNQSNSNHLFIGYMLQSAQLHNWFGIAPLPPNSIMVLAAYFINMALVLIPAL
jgi:hypothetical protein